MDLTLLCRIRAECGRVCDKHRSELAERVTEMNGKKPD
jgi:hypothetical protein